jgi:undecaprenyl-diphosphatase
MLEYNLWMVNKKRDKFNIFDKRLVLILVLIIAFIILGLLLNNKYTILINNLVNQSIQKIQSGFFITLSKIISDIFDNIGVILIALIFSAYLFLTKRRKESIILVLTVILSSISVSILKNLFSVARPLNALLSEADFSFPSGHTSIAVVLFGLFAYFYIKDSKKNKTPVILFSIIGIMLVALSRLYLSVHWFTDILGGLIIGSVWLVLGVYLSEKIHSK